MIINRANLDILYTSYNTAFRQGLIGRQAMNMYDRVAMTVPSGVSEEKYGWLGKFPNLREWIGERVVHAMTQHDYSIRNKDFELTIGVPRNDIEDDKYAVYGTLFQGMGESTAGHADQLIWPMLKAGFDATYGLGYDGQYFFDSDHPVLDADGSPTTASNTGGGAGTPWYLLDTTSMFKPLIFQQRKKGDDIIRRDDPRDDNVFDRNEYEYGVHCRDNGGYGWWQTAYGSKQDLTGANYNTARQSMIGMKGDHGRPLGLMPNLLVVPPSLELKGREILKAERNAAGATNVWMDTAELLVVPWLA